MIRQMAKNGDIISQVIQHLLGSIKQLLIHVEN